MLCEEIDISFEDINNSIVKTNHQGKKVHNYINQGLTSLKKQNFTDFVFCIMYVVRCHHSDKNLTNFMKAI